METPPRYRPDSLEALCKATRFTQAEIKRIYRGFKAECPTGVIKEETFKMIYAQFFPQGGELFFCEIMRNAKYKEIVFSTESTVTVFLIKLLFVFSRKITRNRLFS